MDTATIFSCCRKLHMCRYQVLFLLAIFILINNFFVAGVPVRRRNFLTPRWPPNKMTHTALPKKLFHPELDKFEEELLMGLPSGDGGIDQWNNLIPFEKPSSESASDSYFTRSPLPEDIFPSSSIPFPSEIDTSSDIVDNFSEEVISRGSFVFEGPSSLLNTYIFRPNLQYSSLDVVPSRTIESSSVAQSGYDLSASWTDLEQSDTPFLMSSRRALSDPPSEVFAIITAISATHIFGESAASFFSYPSIMASNNALPSMLKSSVEFNQMLPTVHLQNSEYFYTVSTSVSYLSTETKDIFVTSLSDLPPTFLYDKTSSFEIDLSSSYPNNISQESSNIVANITSPINSISSFFKPSSSCEQTQSVYNSNLMESSETQSETTKSINFIFPTVQKSSGFYDIFTPRTYFLSNVETTVTIVDNKSFSPVIPTFTISGTSVKNATTMPTIGYFIPASIIHRESEDFNDISNLILPTRASLNEMQSQTEVWESASDSNYLMLDNYVSVGETHLTGNANISTYLKSVTLPDFKTSSDISQNFLPETKYVKISSLKILPSELDQGEFNISFPKKEFSTLTHLYETKTPYGTNDISLEISTELNKTVQPTSTFENGSDNSFQATGKASNANVSLNEFESKLMSSITYESSSPSATIENNYDPMTHHVTVRSLKDSFSYENPDDPYEEFTSSRLYISPSKTAEATSIIFSGELIYQSSSDWKISSREMIPQKSLSYILSSDELALLSTSERVKSSDAVMYPSSLYWEISSDELTYPNLLGKVKSSNELIYPSSFDMEISTSVLFYKSSSDWKVSSPALSEYVINTLTHLSSNHYSTEKYDLTPSLPLDPNLFYTVSHQIETTISHTRTQVPTLVSQLQATEFDSSLVHDFSTIPSIRDENTKVHKSFSHSVSSSVEENKSVDESQNIDSMYDFATNIDIQSNEFYLNTSSDDYASTIHFNQKSSGNYHNLDSVLLINPTLTTSYVENSYVTVVNFSDSFKNEETLKISSILSSSTMQATQSENVSTEYITDSFSAVEESNDYLGIFSSRAPLLSYSLTQTYRKETTPVLNYSSGEFMAKISDVSFSKYHESTKIYSEIPELQSSDDSKSVDYGITGVSNDIMSIDYMPLDNSKVMPMNSTLYKILATATLEDFVMQTDFSTEPTLETDSLAEEISPSFFNENITMGIPVTVLPSDFEWSFFDSKAEYENSFLSEKQTDDLAFTADSNLAFSITSKLFPEQTPSLPEFITYLNSKIFVQSLTVNPFESVVSTINENLGSLISSVPGESTKLIKQILSSTLLQDQESLGITPRSLILEDTGNSEFKPPRPHSEFLKSSFFSNETGTSVMPSFNLNNLTSIETDLLNFSIIALKDSDQSDKDSKNSETPLFYSSHATFDPSLTPIIEFSSSNKSKESLSIESDHVKQRLSSSMDPLSIESDHAKHITPSSSSFHMLSEPLSLKSDYSPHRTSSSNFHMLSEPTRIESDYLKHRTQTSSFSKSNDPLSVESDNPKQKTSSSSLHKLSDPLSVETDHPKQKLTSSIKPLTTQIKPTSVVSDPKSIDSDVPKRSSQSLLINSIDIKSSIMMSVKPYLSSFSPKPKDPMSIESDLPKTKSYHSQITSLKIHSTRTPKYIDTASVTYTSITHAGQELFPTKTIKLVSGQGHDNMTSVIAISSLFNQSKNFTAEESARNSSGKTETATTPYDLLIPTMDTTLYKDDYYWVQTILEAPEKGEQPVNFSHTMEIRLANAYSEAFRSKRESEEPINVKILILKTDTFLRQYEIIYVVERGGSLIPASIAAEYLNFLRFEQLREFLGYYAILKAQAYRPKETEIGSPLPILAIVGGTLGTLLLIVCCFCIYCRCCRPKPIPSSPGSSASGSLQRSLSKYGQHNRKHLFREMTHQLTTEMAAQMKHGSTAPDIYLAEKTGRSLPTLPRETNEGLKDDTYEKSLKILKILENKDAATSPIPGKAIKETTETNPTTDTSTKKKKHMKPKKRRKVKDTIGHSSKDLTNGQTISPKQQLESPPPTPPPKLDLSSTINEKEQSIDSGTPSRHVSSKPSTPSDKGDERESEGSNVELLPPIQDLIAQSKSESEAAVAETSQHLSRVRKRISELLEDAFALAGGRKLHGSLRSKKIEPANDIFSRSSSFRSQSAEGGPFMRQISDVSTDPRPISEGGERLMGTITDDGQLITQIHPPPKLVWDEQAGTQSSDRPPVEACNKNINFFPFQPPRIGQLPTGPHSFLLPVLDTLPEGGLDTTVPLSSTINILKEAISEQYLAHSSGMNPAIVDQYDEIDIVSSLKNGEPVEALIQAIKDELQKFNGSQPKSNENESNA